jgi:hypothetical protein
VREVGWGSPGTEKPVDGLCIDGLPVRFVQKESREFNHATASGWLVMVKRTLAESK